MVRVDNIIEIPRLYILVRKDINLSVGKLIIHTGHLCTILTEEIGKSEKEGQIRERNTRWFYDWYDNGDIQTKIILSVKNLDQLNKYLKLADDKTLPNYTIEDAGFTKEVTKGTQIMGCILCYEDDAIKIGLKELSLFR